ncbi:MAG: sulfite oxidase [Gemmatimonadota bacterium]
MSTANDSVLQPSGFGKHARQLVRDPRWFNSGPPADLLRAHFITPRELFFTRNHAAVPELDASRHLVRVGGQVARPIELSMERLRTDFPTQSLAATLICAGLRRNELNAVRPIPSEVQWGTEPVSNGMWRGVRLRDILSAAGVEAGAGHVAFLGADQIERHGEHFEFGASIPLEKALESEVLLAFELNGKRLTPVHGYPVRLVVPGYIGARSVKWLSRIIVQAEPTSNYFQSRAYRIFPPEVSAESVDWETGHSLGEIPLNSVIWQPTEGSSLTAGVNRVQGWALAGGGRRIERVEISADDGLTWNQARLPAPCDPWTWCLWEAELDLQSGTRHLTVRAWDSAGETQPVNPADIWNFKGYANNARHRIKVTVVPEHTNESADEADSFSSPTEPWK